MKTDKIDNAISVLESLKADAAPTGNRHIIVLDRGWIFVGDVTEKDGGYLATNCVNVRKWSSGGFGGLSLSPSGSGAVLDKCAPIKFKDCIFMIPVAEDWDDK